MVLMPCHFKRYQRGRFGALIFVRPKMPAVGVRHHLTDQRTSLIDPFRHCDVGKLSGNHVPVAVT
jgi:hypothetical protein